MKTQRLFIVASLLMVMALISGCTPPEAVRPSGDKPYIPVIAKGADQTFWLAVKTGAEKAAQDFNVQIAFQGPANETEVNRQLDMLKKALDWKPAAICLAALDSRAAIPLLQQAKDAGVPVIAFDSGVDSDIPVATTATDNVAAAALAADKMAELIGASGEVAIIGFDTTSRSGVDRVTGFTEQIKAKYPNITLVDTQYGGGDPVKSTGLVKAIIKAHPNVKGFFGANEGAAMGVISAIQQLNLVGKLTVIGFDSGQDQLDAIRKGIEAGAITQDPVSMGYKCVEAAVKAMQDQTLAKTIDTGFHWYDKTNIDDPALTPLLYK